MQELVLATQGIITLLVVYIATLIQHVILMGFVLLLMGPVFVKIITLVILVFLLTVQDIYQIIRATTKALATPQLGPVPAIKDTNVLKMVKNILLQKSSIHVTSAKLAY